MLKKIIIPLNKNIHAQTLVDRSKIIVSIVMFFLLWAAEVQGAGNYLADRINFNTIGLAGGAKKFSNLHHPLNEITPTSIKRVYCGNIFYQRFMFWQYFGAGLEYEYCENSLKKDASTTNVKEITQITRSQSLQLIVSLPFRQRTIKGPFANQSFELGFLISYGNSSLNYAVKDNEGTTTSEAIDGRLISAMIYFDIGLPSWGLRVSLGRKNYEYPAFSSDFAASYSADQVNQSQVGSKGELGLRFSF